jgi:rhodanese-related sulfurtransferase
MKLGTEILAVAGVGVLVGLAANAVSPRGLELGRNYFPKASVVTATSVSTNGTAQAPPVVGSVAVGAPDAAVLERLRSHGLQPINLADLQAFIADARYGLDQYVVLDDRDREYAEGHIPGAFQFFHYRPQEFLPTLLPVLLAAEKIVVYCGGGSCEDSEFAALMLAEMGIPKERLLVFAGGMKEWKAAGLPLEQGARRSGQLIKPTP